MSSNEHMKNIFKMCLNWKVLGGVGAVIVLAYLFVPQIASYSWLLIVCPLSMILMMAAMNHGQEKSEKLFLCPECGLSYREAEWAKKCAAWCQEYKSCNLAITQHAVKN